MTILTTLLFLAAFSVIAGLLLLRGTAAVPWLQRVCAFLVPPLLLLCLAETVAQILSADHFVWNEIRLARSFGLYAGVPLYPGQDATGPILGTLHTPLSHILYWPATLAGGPVSAVRAGVSLSVLLLLVALVYAHREFLTRRTVPSTSLPPILQLLFALEFFWLGALSTAIMSCVFVIHADPVALTCATFAAGLLCASTLSTRRLLVSALFAVLAVAAKQTFAPLPIALGFFLAIVEGRPTLIRYSLYAAGWAVVVATAILALFRPAKDLIFNLVTLPSHRPPQPIVSTVPHLHDGLGAFCKGLYQLARHGIHSGSEGRSLIGFLLLLCVASYFLLRAPATGAPHTLRQTVSQNRWLIFVLIALVLFPLLFKASITVGGDENHLAIVDFFLLLGLTTGFLQFTQDRRNTLQKRPLPHLLVFLLALSFSYRSIHQFKRAQTIAPSLTAEAAAFSRAHPGVAYFPSNPLSSLYAEHRFYTFDHAIDDREIAGFPLTPAQFASGIPSGIQFIAVEPRDIQIGEISQSLCHYLNSGWVRENTAGLPDFFVYRRASPHVGISIVEPAAPPLPK
jgi:hypothetical protein